MASSLPLPDGSYITAREGETPADTWARAQQMYPEAFAPAQQATPQPAAPKKESLAADLGYSALGGIGNLVAFPGQAYGLATGDMDNRLSKAGKSITDYAQSQQSEGFKARQAKQQAAIAEASKEGFLSEAGTAITSTLKDPVLFGNFIAENIPNLIPGFGISRGTMGVGMRMAAKEIAAQGLEGEARSLALDAAQSALAKKATALAVGTATAQQGADVGSQAYEDIYKKLITQKVPPEQAADRALSLARAAGLSGAAISYLSSRLPGARALEQSFAGATGVKAAGTGAIKGLLGEGVSEGVEEGGGTFARNVAMSTVDPTQNLMQGVGTAVGQGALLGGVLGGVAGMRNSSRAAEVQSQADVVNKQREAYDRVIAARQADADKVARLQDPAYLDDLLVRSQAINTQAQQLTEAAKGNPKDDAKLDPLARAEKENARRAKAEFLKSDEYKDFRAEMGVAAPFLRQRQEKLAPAREAARAAALSPEQEARYAQQPGSQWTSKQTGGRGKGALGVTSKEELAAVRTARETAEETEKQAPILAQQRPLQEYATQQLEHPRSLLLNDTGTFVSYLMEDPAKARSIVETRTPIPDMTPQQNRQVHAALGAAISLRDKQQQKADKAEATAEYAQRTQDLQGQLPQKPTTTEQRMGQTVESLQQSMADDENVRTTGEYNLDYIVPMLEKGFPGGKAPAIAAPATVTQTRTADTELDAIDALQAEFEQANKNEQTAKRANEAGAAEAARSRRQTAADELNKLTSGSPYTREIVRQRFAQQTALDEMQNNAERIRQGQYLGYKFGTGETKAAGLVADLKAQIAAREAAKEKTNNVGELQRINAELTRLNVQLNNARTEATRAADRDQSDLASTTQPLLWKKAEAARDAYVKSTLEEAATHRAARGVNGVTQDEALKAASEMHDLLDLRIDRRDGERNKFINKRLAEIKQQLNHPERARTRVAAEPLATQYAPVEAKKTAEEKGETATTLAGELRRRSDYVGDLVEKALGREMPADVRTALETAQKAIEDKRVTRDLLNAVETQAERVLTGRLKGTKTTYSKDVTQRGRGVAETNLQEDPRYIQDINDALSAMEATPETQGELFAPADNTASIAKREQEITAIDTEIAEEQALHDRLEKAAINNRTDIRPAAERMVGIKADIDAKRQQQDIIRKEIARLKQEEITTAEVAKQVEGLGTPAQEAQVFETEGGFTPDDQAAAFGTPPPLATAVLGFIRDSVKAFARSPAVVKARALANRLQGTTEYAKKRQKFYEELSAPRMQAIADIQKELDETLALLTGHEWIATAYPQLRKRLGGFNIEDALGPILEKDIRDATTARVGTKRLQQKAAKARADIAKERQQINELLAKESAGDADVIAAKAHEVSVGRAQSAVEEQRSVYQNAMDNAREQAITRIRAVRDAIYAPVLARFEGQISGLTVQLETARTAIRERLSKQGPLNVLDAAAKEGGFEPYVEKLFKEETAGIYSALAEAKKAVEDISTRQNETIESDVVNVAAVGDRLVKFEFARLEKLQKALDKLTANKAASPEVVAATEALAQQRGIAEQARQAANDSSDAVYKAKNERLSREATLTTNARVAPLQRRLAALKTAAKKITDKRGFAKLSPVDQAQALVDINAQIAAAQAQMRKVTGETLGSAYTTTARNTSVTARQERLEAMIASPKSSAQRVRRAKQALAVLEQRTRQMGRVIGPVSRDAAPVSSTFNVGDTAAQTKAKTTTAPTSGQRKKYLDQKRAPIESKKSAAETTATLRLQNAQETWNNATALAETEGLSRADKKAADEAAYEALLALDTAQAALEAEQARGKESGKKTSTAKDTRRDAKGARDEDFELGSEEDRVRDATGARDDDVDLASAAEKKRTVLDETASAHVRDGNLLSALEHLSKNASTEFYRTLAAKLAPFVSGTKIGVQRGLTHKGEVAAGMYYGAQNRIAINPLFMTEEDVLHEVLHAATMQVLYNNRDNLTAAQAAAVKQLESLFASIKNNPQFKGEYGATNLDEFITEMYTDPALRDKLDGIGKPTSLLQRILHAVLRMFGMEPSQKALKAIDAILSESGRVDYAKQAGDVNRASKGRSAFENRTQETRSTAQQLFEARGSLGLAFRQATADMRASLREILQRGDSVTGMQAQASLLSADSFVGNAMAVAEQGAFTLSKDSKGYIKMEAGGSKSLVDVLQMASKIPLKNADDRIAKFQGYVTALRGEQVGYDMLDFKDPKGAEVDGRALLAEVRANPEMLKALQITHEVYRDLNKGMIQFLKDTHAISADLANKLLADKNYIPFYREKGGSLEMVLPTGHPQSIGDIRSLPFLQALKGGDDKLMSFPDAAIKNIAILTNLGVQNMANRQIAYHLSAIGRTSAKPTMQVRRRDGGSGNNVLRWKQQPDPAIPNDTGDRHIVLDTEGTAAADIPTDLLTQAVAGSYATFPWLLEAAGTASTLLRTGVTRNPAYLIGQLIKDPFSASMTGNLKASPLRAIAQVIGNFGQIISGTSLEEAALRKAGVVHSNVFSGGKGDLNKVALQIAGNQQGFIRRGLAGLDKLAMSADAATRTQAYKDAIASGASEVEAIVSARELANFSRQGSEASVQFLAKAIPFFNASIQGLDAALRSAQGKMPASQLYAAKQKFFNRAMGLAGMTVAYSLMMDDDEEWRKMSLRDKISYIHIPRIFGQQEPMRLPAPFETGMLFYSMPMAFMEALKGEFTAADLKVVRDVFLAQLPNSGSIMPQFAKGLYDVTRNYNSGTGRPIVPPSLEGKDPAYQFTAQTTEAAKRMAEMLQAVGVKLSAIQLEFLSNSYLGGLPLGIAQMTNQAFAKESKAGVERPAGRASDTPIVGRFFQSERGTDDIDHVYEFANKAKMANDTFNMLKKQGDIEETRAYLLAHRPEIAMAPFAAQFSKVMGTLKQMDTAIDNAPNMSAEAKQNRKDATQKQREQIAKSFREALKRAPAPA
jgi:hypothetical protein